jgi:hypothetical protein
MLLELDKEVELKIVDLALSHIKKVEDNPDVVTDGDNFDYWNSYPLSDGTFVDYNIYESNLGTSSDEEDYVNEWHCSAYHVDSPNEERDYHQINTDIERYIFTYIDGKITYID